jgi:hypothetical protein
VKTTEQIAADCGLDDDQLNWLNRALCSTGLPTDMNRDEVEATEEIIGALYRRIEKLEEISPLMLEAANLGLKAIDLNGFLNDQEREYWEIEGASKLCAIITILKEPS